LIGKRRAAGAGGGGVESVELMGPPDCCGCEEMDEDEAEEKGNWNCA